MEKEAKTIHSPDVVLGYEQAKALEKIALDVISSSLTDIFPKEIITVLIGPWCHTMSHACVSIIQNGVVDESQKWRPELAPGETIQFMVFSRDHSFYEYLSNNCDFSKLKINISTCIIKIPFFIFGKILFFQTGHSKIFFKKLIFSKLFFFSKLSFKKRIVNYLVSKEQRIRLKMNLCIALKDFNNSRWISERFSEMFPRSLLEGLPDQKAFYSRPYKFKAIYSSDSWSSLDSFKIFSFSQRQLRSIKFIGTPHSLNYSTLNDFWLRNYELSFLDSYLLWGNFKITASHKCIPFYITKFVGKKFPKPILGQSNKIIFSGAARPSHTIEYPYVCSAFKSYLIDQLDLAQKISYLTDSHVVIRTRSKDRGSLLEEIYNTKPMLSNVNIEYQDGIFINTLNNYCLHITDNTSTTILESFWLNFPTLILIKDDYFNLSKNAFETFTELKKVGIFHTSGENLLEHLSKIHLNIEEWWCLEQTQNAVQNFLEKHGRGMSDVKIWRNQFLRFL